MNTNLKEGFKVILFDSSSFSFSELSKMNDSQKLQTAEENTYFTSVYDSLDEFQEAFNDDSIDEVNNFIFFVQNITPSNLESIKQTYQKENICMAELLAAEPADGLSMEQAFELYVQAKNWADSDTFYLQRNGEELTEITSARNSLMTEMDRAYNEFYKKNNRFPIYADCEVSFKDDGTTTQMTITMDSAEQDDDSYYYCNSLDGLKGLTNPDNCSDFIVTGFFNFK